MDMTDFKLYFESVAILKYRDHWKYCFVELQYSGEKQSPMQCVQLRVKHKSTVVNLSMKQPTITVADGLLTEYSDMRFTVIQVSPMLRVVTHSFRLNTRDLNSELTLTQGDYLVMGWNFSYVYLLVCQCLQLFLFLYCS